MAPTQELSLLPAPVHAHGHDCNHRHAPHEQPLPDAHVPSDAPESVSRTWQIAATAGNLLIGTAELLASGSTEGLSTVAVDGAHNIGDMSYGIQAEAARRRVSEERRAKLRKI